MFKIMANVHLGNYTSFGWLKISVCIKLDEKKIEAKKSSVLLSVQLMTPKFHRSLIHPSLSLFVYLVFTVVCYYHEK